MLDFDPPRIKRSLGEAALREPYPCWTLDAYGVVRSANLMAFWLWDKLGHSEAIRPELLIGRNIFAIQAENFERIPLLRNIEFYTKWSALVKSVANQQTSSPYTSLIAKMKTDPHRAAIYEGLLSDPEHIWEYRLLITVPIDDEPLELCVTTYRLENEAGFLVMSNPTTTALSEVEEQHSRLIEQYGEKAYIISEQQEQPGENRGSFFSNFPAHYRIYYPTMIQDPLWYIIEENKAQQLLFGASSVGMHFFELFFAPQLRPWLGPLQETSGPRALKYFERFTLPFQQEEHELHMAYTQVTQRLLQIPDYRRLRDISWKLIIHLNLPTDAEAPFYSCRVFLPWSLAPEITLQFRSMVRFLYKGLLITKNQHYYEETLIPENYETEVALLLLYLSSDSNENMQTMYRQMLWGLALLKTLLEGLRNLEDGDARWNPEAAFARISQDLENNLSEDDAAAQETLTSELHRDLHSLMLKGDGETLLALLKSVAISKALKHFGAFLEQEQKNVPQREEISYPWL